MIKNLPEDMSEEWHSEVERRVKEKHGPFEVAAGVADWNPDERFLDFSVEKMKREGIDPNKPITHNLGITRLDLIEHYRQGKSEVMRKAYELSYRIHNKEFLEYRKQKE